MIRPSDPPVIFFRLAASSWKDSSTAIVMMTNAWLLVRSTMRPMPRATAAAASAPSGMSRVGIDSSTLPRIGPV